MADNGRKAEEVLQEVAGLETELQDCCPTAKKEVTNLHQELAKLKDEIKATKPEPEPFAPPADVAVPPAPKAVSPAQKSSNSPRSLKVAAPS
jgi:hypothetical protein